jgi:hypothetical protein
VSLVPVSLRSIFSSNLRLCLSFPADYCTMKPS